MKRNKNKNNKALIFGELLIYSGIFYRVSLYGHKKFTYTITITMYIDIMSFCNWRLNENCIKVSWDYVDN